MGKQNNKIASSNTSVKIFYSVDSYFCCGCCCCCCCFSFHTFVCQFLNIPLLVIRNCMCVAWNTFSTNSNIHIRTYNTHTYPLCPQLIWHFIESTFNEHTQPHTINGNNIYRRRKRAIICYCFIIRLVLLLLLLLLSDFFFILWVGWSFTHMNKWIATAKAAKFFISSNR